MPRHLSSDHDPLFRFDRWRANLRVLEVDEIKTIPGTPRSHAFVERLIGTVRREYLDRIWFWNQSDLEGKLEEYQAFYNQYRCQRACGKPARSQSTWLSSCTKRRRPAVRRILKSRTLYGHCRRPSPASPSSPRRHRADCRNRARERAP